MLTQLAAGNRVVGAKQAKRALNEGTAATIFLAKDADPKITEPLVRLAREKGVLVIHTPGMRDLGQACGIAVGAAVAVLLQE